MRLLFVLPSRGGGGGAHSVAQEAIGLQRLGASVGIATATPMLSAFRLAYPELDHAHLPIHGFSGAEELGALLPGYDIACATTWESVHLLAGAIAATASPIRTAYYIQDYEPLFVAPGTPAWDDARRSYAELPNATLFAKTGWLCDLVARNHGRPVQRVKPSIDHGTFFPGAAPRGRTPTIVAMVRPKTARRAPARTVRILERLADRGDGLSLVAFGADGDDLRRMGLRPSPAITVAGPLRRREVADVLRTADLFLDLSDYQAFGRTGLEAMACGCVALLPLFGGARDYVRPWDNGFLADTRSDEEVLALVDGFLALDPAARERMRLSAIETALDYTVEKAAFSEYQLFRRMLG
jgi:glycosyltransferase involved in cell wall biosynthesis